MFYVNFGVRQGSVLATFSFAVYLEDLARSCSTTNATFIMLYADDILLIVPSVCELEKLLRRCEELYSVDSLCRLISIDVAVLVSVLDVISLAKTLYHLLVSPFRAVKNSDIQE